MKKLFALLLSTIMVLSLLAGCGVGGEAEGNEEAEVRDSVTLATNMVISSIHPFDGATLQNNIIRTQLYDSFYNYNDATKEFEPRVAESYEVSDDGLVYTFHLREDAKFHNGDPVTAEDAVYSVEYALSAPSLTSFVTAIEGAEAVDEHTVNIKLKYQSAPFMMMLTNVKVVSKAACEEAGDALGHSAVLCGSGPYYVEEYNPDVQIVLKAFEDYYLGAASIKTVTFKPITDSSTGLIAFENGELDYYSIPTSDWDAISGSGAYNTELVAENHISYISMGYNGVLADKNVRLAIAHCVNKEAMNIGAYNGLAKVAVGMVNKDYVIGAPDESIVYEYDLDKAREYLAAAGYPDGVDIGSILTIAGGYFEKIALILQDSMAEVGITCTIDGMEQSAAIAQMTTGDFDLMVCGYAGQYDYDFWKAMTHTKSDANMFVKLGRADPALGLKADEIDAAYDAAEVELDAAARNDLYKKVDDLLMETVCYLPVFHRTQPYAWNKDLKVVNHADYYRVYEWSWNN